MTINNLNIWITLSFTTWFWILIHPQEWFIIPDFETGRHFFKNKTFIQDTTLQKQLDSTGVYRHIEKKVYIKILFFTFRIIYLERSPGWYLVDRKGNLKVDSESDRYYQLLNECI